MTERRLHYRFHNPNPVERTAADLLKIFLEADAEKVKTAIQKAADTTLENIHKAQEKRPM